MKWLFSIIAVATVACISSCVPRLECVPGIPVECLCPNNVISRAACGQNAALGPCLCSDGVDGSAGGTAGGGANGSGGSGALGAGGGAGSAGSTGGTGASGGSGGGDGFPPIEDASACTTMPIEVEVVDAEYSPQLDVIAILTGSPDSVAILHPTTQEAIVVDLPLPGVAISVSPDGRSAAVGHDGQVSIVDIEASVLQGTMAVATPVFDVAFGPGGYVYAMPDAINPGEVHVVDVAAGAEAPMTTTYGLTYPDSNVKLHPGGQYLYATSTVITPVDVVRIPVDGAQVGLPMDSKYHGEFRMCGDLWITSDGERILTGCGTAFRAAPGEDTDVDYAGTLEGTPMDAPSNAPYFRSLAADVELDRVFAVPQEHPYDPRGRIVEGSLEVFGFEFLEHQSTLTIPCMTLGDAATWMLGRFVFVSDSGDSVYVLSFANAPSLGLRWGLSVLPTD